MPSTCCAIPRASRCTGRGPSGRNPAPTRSTSRCSAPPLRQAAAEGSGRSSSDRRHASRMPRSTPSSSACEPRPIEQVVAEIKRSYPAGVPAAAQPFLEDPAGALDRLVAEMRAFWDATLAPWWAKISAALESEIAARARALVGRRSPGGVRRAAPDRLVGQRHAARASHRQDGRGRRACRPRPPRSLPAVFIWPRVWPRTDAPWDPALVLSTTGHRRPLGTRSPRADALEAVLGKGRAQVLLELDRPACTLELGAAPGGQPRRREQPPVDAQARRPREPAPRRTPRHLHAHRGRRHLLRLASGIVCREVQRRSDSSPLS